MMRTWMMVGLTCLLLTGCNTLVRPRAEVVAIEPGEQSAVGAVVNVTVHLVNPNEMELPIRRIRYRVSLDGQTFAFDARPAATMPAHGEQSVTLAAAFETGSRAMSGRTAEVSGRVYYQPPGKLREALTDMKIPLPHASFSSSTTLE